MPVRRVTKKAAPAEDLELETTEETPAPKRKKRQSSRSTKPKVVDPPVVVEDIYEDEDEDEAPPRSSMIQVGWAAASKVASEATTGKYFKASSVPQLVRFLDPNSVLTYRQHWVEGTGQKSNSFMCLGTRECPLCLAGSPATVRYVFTLLNFSLAVPTEQEFTVGVKVMSQLQALQEDRRTGPLDKFYYSLSAIGPKGEAKNWSIVPVKVRDLEEDWDVEQEWADDLSADAVAFTAADLKDTPTDVLEEVATYVK